MALKTRTYDPPPTGVGEPASIRAAADEQLRNELDTRIVQRLERTRTAEPVKGRK